MTHSSPENSAFHTTAQTDSDRSRDAFDLPVGRLRELLEKATKGPWQIVSDLPALAIRSAGRSSIVQTPNQNAWQHYGAANRWDGVHGEANARLIVETINALPHLLDRLEQTHPLIVAPRTALEGQAYTVEAVDYFTKIGEHLLALQRAEMSLAGLIGIPRLLSVVNSFMILGEMVE